MQASKLSDLIDIPRLQELMDDFYLATSTPSAILDNDGTVLTASGWQKICTDFHRADEQCALRCQQSDAYIVDHLSDGQEYVLYECANGLVDVANPIMVHGVHLGTVFTGQFLLAPPDVEYFRQQAHEFGFDEAAYLDALATVPVIEREKITPILRYLSRFTQMLAHLGAERLQQMHAQEELEHAKDEQARLQAQLLEAQQSMIRELSTPMLPLSDNVIAMPLVGTIDSNRATMVMETLLEGISEHSANIAIVDITGVKIVDTQVAQALIQTAQAVKLLGATVILTGIQPQIAQTLVHLGADLGSIVTRSTLQAGVEWALQNTNHTTNALNNGMNNGRRTS
jgi:anti-anti-sigma regulatory factor/ligand-binding sensor protein